MQLVPNFPSPPPLPEPPLLEHLALEASGWPASLIALLGLTAFLVLNARGKLPDAIKIGVGSLLLAGLVWGIGRYVETPRERIADQGIKLVDAVAAADTAAVRKMLDESIKFEGLRFLTGKGREEILSSVSATFQGVSKLHSWAVLSNQAYVPAAGPAQTMLLVRVETESERVVNFSWWLLDWKQTPSGEWLVARIEPLAIQGLFNAKGGN